MLRWLIVIFLALVFINGLSPLLPRPGLGRLPGDFTFKLFGRDWSLPLASTVLHSTSRTKVQRRRWAAACQGWAGAAGSAPSTRGVRPVSARATLFQKPCHGSAGIDPRCTGGAVTLLGWRTSRKGLRAAVACGSRLRGAVWG